MLAPQNMFDDVRLALAHTQTELNFTKPEMIVRARAHTSNKPHTHNALAFDATTYCSATHTHTQ